MALAFKWSASGYRLQATREDEVAARSIGIGVMRERLIAFGLSGMLCGIGGALAVHQSGVLNPTTFYFGATVTTMTMLVRRRRPQRLRRGDRGDRGGERERAAARASRTAPASSARSRSAKRPGLAAIGLGLILLATMIAMPKGLSGGREAGELAWLQRLGLSAPAPPPRGPTRPPQANRSDRSTGEEAACAPRESRSPSPGCGS